MGVTAPPLTALLAMGTFGRPHGVRGELTFWPDDGHPTPAGSPLGWGLVWVETATGLRPLRVDKARSAGDHWLVTLAEIGTREAAAQLTKLRVLVPRSVLPPLAEGEFYVADTVGLEVRDQDDRNLGRVVSTFWNGAQDVAIVKSQNGEETLLPLVDAVVQRVDLVKKLLTVLWEVDESVDEPETGS